MADVSVTAASVKVTSSTIVKHVFAGAAITAGQVVYRKTSDGEYYLADASAAATGVPAGIALHTSADGQPLAIATHGNLTFGAYFTAGELYVLSATAGKIAPVGDLTASEFNIVIGSATTTTNLQIDIRAFTTTQRTGAVT